MTILNTGVKSPVFFLRIYDVRMHYTHRCDIIENNEEETNYF